MDETHPGPATTRGRRRLQGRMMSLMVVIACCGVLVWFARVVWENRDLAHSTMQAAVRALRSRDATERLSAARDLGHLGAGASDVAVPALIAALKDPDSNVRAAAANGLGQVVADPPMARSAAGPLTDSLKDAEADVRMAAVNALWTLATVKRSQGRPPLDAGQALAVLMERLDDPDGNVRSAVLEALAVVGPEAGVAPPPPLVALLDDPSAEKRAAAAAAISAFKAGLDAIVPIFLRRLEQEGPSTRAAYARALGRVRPPGITPAVLPPLMAALENRDPEIRIPAMSCIGQLGPEAVAAVPALIKALHESIDSDPGAAGPTDLSRAAASALGRIAPGTPRANEAVAALTEVLRRGHPKRRGPAAAALGEFAEAAEPAIPALIDVLRSSLPSEPSARDGGNQAAETLGYVAPETKMADQAIDALGAALEAKAKPTRIAAIDALPRFGSARALPLLQKLTKDQDAQIRTAAAAAVGQLEEILKEQPGNAGAEGKATGESKGT